MKKIKSVAVFVLLSVFCAFAAVSAVPECVYGQTSGDWSITHSLNVSECSSGDAVTLSVFLKKGSGTADSLTVSGMDGELEYDSSLFEISDADVTPVGSPSSVGFREGSISIRYSSGVKVADGGLLFSIRLHVKDSGSSGRTTVCVTNLSLGSDAGTQTVSNFVPSAVTITGADAPEDEDWEEDEDEDPEDETEDDEDSEDETKGDKNNKKNSTGKKNSKTSAASNNAQKTAKTTKSAKKTPFQTGDDSKDNRSLAAGGILLLMGISLLFARGKIR